jgi:hypothetical protein
MEQFIGCDAQKKFSVLVAVNEKGHAGEALQVAHVLAWGLTGTPVNRCGPAACSFSTGAYRALAPNSIPSGAASAHRPDRCPMLH